MKQQGLCVRSRTEQLRHSCRIRPTWAQTQAPPSWLPHLGQVPNLLQPLSHTQCVKREPPTYQGEAAKHFAQAQVRQQPEMWRFLRRRGQSTDCHLP